MIIIDLNKNGNFFNVATIVNVVTILLFFVVVVFIVVVVVSSVVSIVVVIIECCWFSRVGLVLVRLELGLRGLTWGIGGPNWALQDSSEALGVPNGA